MSRARIYLRNITANWIGYGINLAVMFFMSPFVVRTLGDERYGVWSLLISLTGYLGLVELGTRAGLGRYINYYLGKEDIPKLNGVINTAMAMLRVVQSLDSWRIEERDGSTRTGCRSEAGPANG